MVSLLTLASCPAGGGGLGGTIGASDPGATEGGSRDNDSATSVPDPGETTGEACDDSNDDNTEGCISTCTVPLSCLDIVTAVADGADGVYLVDPDGPVGAAADEVFCDMTRDGGGWTLLTWTYASICCTSEDQFATGVFTSLAGPTEHHGTTVFIS